MALLLEIPLSSDDPDREEPGLCDLPLRGLRQVEFYIDEGSVIRAIGRRLLLGGLIAAVVIAWPFVAISSLLKK